jgi:hypothetical protein
MQCERCKSTKADRWRGNICNSCYLKQWRKDNIISVVRYDKSILRRFNKANRIAKKRKISWTLSMEEFLGLCSKSCYYCDNTLGKVVQFGVGLDRIDSSLGYQMDNVVPCCKCCNMIKNDILSLEEMIQVVTLIVKLRNKA